MLVECKNYIYFLCINFYLKYSSVCIEILDLVGVGWGRMCFISIVGVFYFFIVIDLAYYLFVFGD